MSTPATIFCFQCVNQPLPVFSTYTLSSRQMYLTLSLSHRLKVTTRENGNLVFKQTTKSFEIVIFFFFPLVSSFSSFCFHFVRSLCRRRNPRIVLASHVSALERLQSPSFKPGAVNYIYSIVECNENVSPGVLCTMRHHSLIKYYYVPKSEHDF